ncbi:MAG: type II secretion system protein GspD, partial [Nitrospirae bacterium]
MIRLRRDKVKRASLKGWRVVCLFLVFLLLSSSILYSATDKRDGVTNKAEKVAFNFMDVELPVLAKFVSDITGKNFIFDDRFKGKITIIAPSKLDITDAFSLFSSVLEFKGYALVPSGVDAYKIVRSSDAKMKGLDVITTERREGEDYVVRLIPLKHISSEEALSFLRPVVSREGYISMFRSGNILLIIDTALNIEKVMKIIENIDRPALLEAPEIIKLEYASAEEMARILNEGVRQTTVGGVGKPISGASGYAVADTRLNAVVLFGKKQAKEEMKRVITLLDVPSSEEQGRINVYFLENADAEELAKVLKDVVKKTTLGKPRTVRGRSTGTTTQTQEIQITPDRASNALI